MATTTRTASAITLPVPGELGAVLRELGYAAELVVRRADGREPRPAEPSALALVMEAAEAADASGRACGVNLRTELAARSVASGPANRASAKPRAKSTARATAARTATTRGR